MRDDDDSWVRPLVAGLGALVAVALVIGGLVGAVALGAVKLSGTGESQAAPEAERSLYIPERTAPRPPLEAMEPTPADPSGDPSGEPDDATTSPAPSATPNKPKKPKKPRSVISLSATPVAVSPMEEVYLTGTFPGGEGAQLQVQRFEGGWDDFPADTSVTGGTFTTYVRTGRPGVNRFRVVDPASGKASNPVSVRVG